MQCANATVILSVHSWPFFNVDLNGTSILLGTSVVIVPTEPFEMSIVQYPMTVIASTGNSRESTL